MTSLPARERVLTLREGYVACFRAIQSLAQVEWIRTPEEMAAQAFPLPPVTRPRVVRDSGQTRWRLVDGKFQYHGATDWVNVQETYANPTPERVRLWADLLDHPTEEVSE